MKPIAISLGGFGGAHAYQAMESCLSRPVADPVLGTISIAHAQICPQNRDRIDAESLEFLQDAYPDTQFRLHANVKLASQTGFRQEIIDLVDYDVSRPYFSELARHSRQLRAPAYTAHAGRRAHGDIESVIRAAIALENEFGCPVGVEGHYPTPDNDFLFSSWEEHRVLMESGAHYAIDLSHFNIIAFKSHRKELQLVIDLVANERCIEVHVSGNNGLSDQHRALVKPAWWMSALPHINPDATIFYEGIQQWRQ